MASESSASNITDERHACSWVEDYGLKTNTSWVVDFVKPTAKCERMVFHKVWRCKEAKREKSCGEAAAHCPAKIDLKIKKVNRNTKCNDAFLREEKPLPAVIKLFITKTTATALQQQTHFLVLLQQCRPERPFWHTLTTACHQLKPSGFTRANCFCKKMGMPLLPTLQ
ncbi:hypothetical protein MRX96_029929 [Rhipicephalus microplus]